MKKGSSNDSNLNKFVFDSNAIIAYLNHESGYELVKDILRKGKAGKNRIFISFINFGEVIYYLLKQRNKAETQEIIGKIKRLPIIIAEIDEKLTWLAAEMKAQGGISYADAFVIATAIKYDASIVTGDKEFKKFEKKVRIDWL